VNSRSKVWPEKRFALQPRALQFIQRANRLPTDEFASVALLLITPIILTPLFY